MRPWCRKQKQSSTISLCSMRFFIEHSAGSRPAKRGWRDAEQNFRRWAQCAKRRHQCPSHCPSCTPKRTGLHRHRNLDLVLVVGDSCAHRSLGRWSSHLGAHRSRALCRKLRKHISVSFFCDGGEGVLWLSEDHRQMLCKITASQAKG